VDRELNFLLRWSVLRELDLSLAADVGIGAD
jgi:hypothetical protein